MCLGIPGCIVQNRRCGEYARDRRVGGVRRQINISCIVDDGHPAASCIGDWVLVHVGFAMSRIDETEAAATLRSAPGTGRGAGGARRHARGQCETRR